METREVLEHVEQSSEAAERHESLGRRAAVLVSVLAAMLAISSLAGNRATTDAVLNQQRASDAYNEYQANSLKRHVNENDALMIRALAAGGAHEAEADQIASKLEKAVAEKYLPNQKKLLPKAEGLEHAREQAEERHRGFQVSEAAFQLGIVVTSVAIVASAAWLVWAGLGLGVAGLIFAVNAFTGLVTLP